MNTECVVARNINGITLNNYEYILEDTGKMKVFQDKNFAVDFLKQHGYSEEDMEFLRFFDYQKLEKNIYKEVI